MIDIVNRLQFDATRCEATFSKGVASNINAAITEIERLRAALGTIRGLAYSDAPAEMLEEAQGDLRNIYDVAVKALVKYDPFP